VKTVAVIGAGPSGLAVAHAAYITGYSVHIFSIRKKSDLYGCQYLHAPLSGMPTPVSTVVDYQLQGTAQEYRDKVYGGLWPGEVSPSSLQGRHPAWNLRQAYDWLWDEYVESGNRGTFWESNIAPDDLVMFQKDSFSFSHVVSTMPIKSICVKPQIHTFVGNEIWAIGDAPDMHSFSPVTPPPDTIICNGEESPSWYRISKVFDVATAEWPGRIKPPIGNLAKVVKPLYTDCDCWPQVTKLGRYGAWEKGGLVHNVFYDAMELFNG
jgi:hypothetical protein